MGATAPAERIESLDILRGLALFGVLVVNLVSAFRMSVLQHFVSAEGLRPAHDVAADTLIRVLLEGKAITIFAFLFGAGLAIQHERFARAGLPPRAMLARRLGVLFAFGLIHLLLVWNGDILTEYALIGLVALAFVAAPEALLRRWMVVLVAASMVLMSASFFLFPEAPELATRVEEASRIYGTAGYLENRAYSLQELALLMPFLAALLPQTLAMFLAGIVAWRRGYLRDADLHAPALRRLAAVGLALGAALTLLNEQELAGLQSVALLVTIPLTPLLLAMGYAAALLLLLRREPLRHAMRAFGAVGRMAFTNYIMQSLVFSFLFFGYGLGLFGKLGTLEALPIGLALYAFQLWFSVWWLARFRYGPLEWAWRSLTYGERQPMRR